MLDGRPATPIGFPLRGEWQALRTPGSRVPSHGTDGFGQRYAYDLWRVDQRAGGYHRASRLRMWLIGVPTRDCYGWGAPVHSPVDGTVVQAVDGVAERAWLHPLRELVRILVMSVTFRPERAAELAGNHVVVRGPEGHVLVAHLAPGSVAVSVGQEVHEGDLLGRVGHTGNSTAPHLHLQLMDGPDGLTAQGLPASFRDYEARRVDAWERVRDGIPKTQDRIRSIDPERG